MHSFFLSLTLRFFSYAIGFGVSSSQAASLLMIMGLTNIIFRIAAG